MTPPSAEIVYSAHMVARRRAVRAARRARVRRAMMAALTAAALAYGGWALVHSSLFAVDGIRVAGLERVSRAELLAVSGIRIGMNVLSVDTRAVAERIEALPYVESARVERVYPSKLRIVVTERVPAALLALPGGKWIIDAHGIPLEPVAETAGLPAFQSASGDEVRIGSPVLDAGVVEALTVWRTLPGTYRHNLKAIDATSPSSVALEMYGMKIVLGSSDRLLEKLRVLQLVLDRARAEGKKVRSVDLRAPERPAARYF